MFAVVPNYGVGTKLMTVNDRGAKVLTNLITTLNRLDLWQGSWGMRPSYIKGLWRIDYVRTNL